MRYADLVTLKFKDDKTKRYDPELGKMVGGAVETKEVHCNVTGASLELKSKLGDLLNATSIVVRFRHPIDKPVDTLVYGSDIYKPVTVRGYLAGRNVIYANKVVR